VRCELDWVGVLGVAVDVTESGFLIEVKHGAIALEGVSVKVSEAHCAGFGDARLKKSAAKTGAARGRGDEHALHFGSVGADAAQSAAADERASLVMGKEQSILGRQKRGGIGKCGVGHFDRVDLYAADNFQCWQNIREIGDQKRAVVFRDSFDKFEVMWHDGKVALVGACVKRCAGVDAPFLGGKPQATSQGLAHEHFC